MAQHGDGVHRQMRILAVEETVLQEAPCQIRIRLGLVLQVNQESCRLSATAGFDRQVSGASCAVDRNTFLISVNPFSCLLPAFHSSFVLRDLTTFVKGSNP